MGLLFVGIAVGPTIGGLLISKTGDLLSVYYLAASIHLLYLVSVLFIVPESLSKEEMASNREAHAENIKRGREKERRRGSGFWYSCWAATRRAFFFLKPLTVFLPKERAGKQKGRNWNLTFLMISYSFVAMIVVSTRVTSFAKCH
jgi:MFS family permease